MRRALLVVALLVLVLSVGAGIALPRYSCREGYRLVTESGPGASPTGVACVGSDVGYVPDSRMPLKVAIGVGGSVVAVALALVAIRGGRRIKSPARSL